MTRPDLAPTPAWLLWTERVLALAALVAVTWACITAWSAIVHGHPAYAVLLALTAAVAVAIAALSFARTTSRGGWRTAARVTGAVLGAVWIAGVAWLRPFPAVEPALAAMDGRELASVEETLTTIELTPAVAPLNTSVAVLVQPGARVDPRAYAAHFLPLAEAGYHVRIVKQPLGIAFTSLGVWPDPLREPYAASWVVAGHSLGGTVAAIQAGDHQDDEAGGAAGLLLLGSYPAGDVSDSLTVPVLSISGSADGLSTPDDIEASRANLPDDAAFVVIEGASHAQFGAYGPQPGDGAATISDDEARAAISAAALAFVDEVAGATGSAGATD